MCPHTIIYVSSCRIYEHADKIEALLLVSSYCYICVLILVCMCPHTPIYVSSY
jgi:hypothetical protein